MTASGGPMCSCYVHVGGVWLRHSRERQSTHSRSGRTGAGACACTPVRWPPAVQGAREIMAKITAAHLAEQLRRAGFVVMQRPPAAQYAAPSARPDGPVRDQGG